MSSPTVAVIVGSIRKDSFSGKIARILQGLAPATMEFTPVQIAGLPLYNQDEETGAPPPAWTMFRRQIQPVNAVLFVTPEYNRSIPGVLKNAVDVGSRPWGHSVWSGKAGAIASCSPGTIGGFAANQHLRQSLGGIGMRILPTPEVYLGTVQRLLDEKGDLANDGVRGLLTTFMQSFANWIEAVSALK